MSDDAGMWLAIALMVVGLSYVSHLHDVDCQNRGGTVVEEFWWNKCEGAK